MDGLPTIYVHGDVYVSSEIIVFNPDGLPVNLHVYGDVCAEVDKEPKTGLFCKSLNIQGNITAENF